MLNAEDLANDRAATWRALGIDPDEAEKNNCWLAPSVASALEAALAGSANTIAPVLKLPKPKSEPSTLEAICNGAEGQTVTVELASDVLFKGQKIIMHESDPGAADVVNIRTRRYDGEFPRTPVAVFSANQLSDLYMKMIEVGDAYVFVLEFKRACEVRIVVAGRAVKG